MEYILKKDGYVWSVSGRKGFEIYFNLGKDPEDERWAEDKPKKKRNRTKKEEDI